MRLKPLTLPAAVLAAAALALPACGGEEEPTKAKSAAGSVPPEQVKGVERRVGELEKELEKLRKDLERVRDEQSSADDGADETAAADAAPTDTAAAGNDGAGSGAGAGASSGDGSGSGSGGGSGGGNEGGGGPDPATREDDPSVEDICGENPAPTC